MHSCNDMRMNTPETIDGASNFLSAESDLFKTVISYILGVVGVVIVIGVIFEVMRYRSNQKTVAAENTTA